MLQELRNFILGVLIILIMDFLYYNDVVHTGILCAGIVVLFLLISVFGIFVFWVADKIRVPWQVDVHD
jgi:hypothetical protein